MLENTMLLDAYFKQMRKTASHRRSQTKYDSQTRETLNSTVLLVPVAGHAGLSLT